MKLYHFDTETGELKGESQAQPNPARPGEFLTKGPNRTTTPPPNVQADQVAVFESGAWAVKADRRGHVYWTPDGGRVEIDAIGIEPPADALDAPPPPPDLPARLSPPQFEFLLTLTGFGDVWDALADQAKATGDLHVYAALRAERKRSRFNLDRVLKVVAAYADAAAQIAPDVDLSETAIRTAWEQAEQFEGL